MGKLNGLQLGRTVKEFRKLRERKLVEFGGDSKIGFVPTMGNLHEGHMSLVKLAREQVGENGLVAASIFVNPGQFAPHEDFDSYPRTLEEDLAMLAEEDVDLVFAPETEEMYPVGSPNSTHGFDYSNSVQVHNDFTTLNCDATYNVLEGKARPGFFRGVATVVNMLFNVVQPNYAVFGQKDYQQCAVVKKMVQDLKMPVEIVTAPIKREENGLAMSSRNNYLTDEERESAGKIFASLTAGKQAFDNGEELFDIRNVVEEALEGFEIDYISITDQINLQDLSQLDDRNEGAVISVAVFHGEKRTRLIDNIEIGIEY